MKKLLIILLLIPAFLFAKDRSREWSKVRNQYLKQHSACEVCGSKKDVQVHHIKPFHSHPELELDPSNLITLCVSKYWGFSCHLAVGHGGNWKWENPFVWEDIETIRQIMYDRKLTPERQAQINEYLKSIRVRVKAYNEINKVFYGGE